MIAVTSAARDDVAQRAPCAIRAAPLNGIDFLEVVDDGTQRNAARPLPASRSAGRSSLDEPTNVRDRRRRARDRPRDRRRRARAADGDVARPSTVDRARRLLDLHAAARAGTLGDRRPAAPASTRCSRRSTSRSRSTARATSTARPCRRCPPDAGREPEIDYLAKDYASFRRLMLDRLASLVPDWRERNAGRPRHRARRAARLRRRPAQLLPGRRRHRGLPRHGAPARLGAPPRAAGRLPRCTTAATRASGCRSGCRRTTARRTRASSLDARHASADRGAAACRRCSTRRPSRLALGSQPRGVRDHARRSSRTERTRSIALLHLGRRASAACRTARRRRRCAASSPTSRPATCSSSTSGSGRRPASGRRRPAHRQAVRLTARRRASTDAIGGRFERAADVRPVDVTEIDGTPTTRCPSRSASPPRPSRRLPRRRQRRARQHRARRSRADGQVEEPLPTNRVEHLGVVPEPVLFLPAARATAAPTAIARRSRRASARRPPSRR